jgi:hybrid cluster-associated redox disulfide protein
LRTIWKSKGAAVLRPYLEDKRLRAFFCCLRQRKDKNPIQKYAKSRMNAILPRETTTVEEVFQNLPGASHIFMKKHHTGCVGCRLARFCTLEEVANIYEINLQSLLNDLEQSAQSTLKNLKE